MANRIVGLDIGAWAVKALTLEVQRELEVVDYREIVLDDLAGRDGSAAESESEQPEGEAPEAGGDWREDAPESEADGYESYEDEDSEEDPLWVKALRQLQGEGFFEGVTRVITSFPDGKAVTLHVEVPFEKKVDSILPHLLSDQLPLSIHEVIHDFFVVPGTAPDTFEALVGVVERSDLAAFLLQIQGAGVDPAIVGVPELMLRNALEGSIELEVESYGVIDFGHEFTRLLIMSGGRPVLARTVRTGGAAITAELARKFRLSEEEATRLKHQRGRVGELFPSSEQMENPEAQIGAAVKAALQPLVRDLRRTFQSAYAKQKVAVDEIHICGGTSRLAGLEEYLHGEFQVPVKKIEAAPLLVWASGAAAERLPESAMALGAALQGPMEQGEKRLIDFRQEEFVFRGKSSFLRGQMVRLGAAAAILLVMLVGVLAMQYLDQRAQLRAMQSALAEQSAELFGEAVRSPAEVQRRLAGDAGPDRSFVPRMSAYELMVQILDHMNESMPLQLEQIQIDTGRNLATLVGITDTPQSVDVFASGIERMDCVSEVRKEGVNVRGENDVRFELNITNNCS